MTNTTPHDVDIHVGKMIRKLRSSRGLTQMKLAEKVGVKFQQIQKYETGANRVSASRLWEICNALGCSVMDVFPTSHAQNKARFSEDLSAKLGAAKAALNDLSSIIDPLKTDTIDIEEYINGAAA